jgi:hypothetical protein
MFNVMTLIDIIVFSCFNIVALSEMLLLEPEKQIWN